MNKLLEQAFDAVRKLPPERQDELAEMLLAVSGGEPYRVSDDERSAIEAGMADAAAGHFATEDEAAALFGKLRNS